MSGSSGNGGGDCHNPRLNSRRMARSAGCTYFAVAFCNCWQRAGAVGAPAARFQKTRDAQIEGKRLARVGREVEAIGQFLGRRRRARRARQLVQPVTDRPVERVALDRPKRRRMLKRLQQDSDAMLAIVPDRATALRRQVDRVAGADLDKHMVGPRPRPLNRGDQPLPAPVGVQVADRAAALIGPRLADLSRKAAVDVVLVKRKPCCGGKRDAGRRKIVQGRYPLYEKTDRRQDVAE